MSIIIIIIITMIEGVWYRTNNSYYVQLNVMYRVIITPVEKIRYTPT